MSAVKAVVLALLLIAQSDADLVRQGVALFDQGKIDEAIAKYREVLAKNPSNADAIYELALAYTAKRDFQQCRALLEPALPLERREGGAHLHMALGNCLDASGEPQKAIEVYRQGLALAPGDPRLSYNLAVTLIGKKKLDEARQLLEHNVAAEPEHASGHYALAKVFEAQNFRVPAFLEYLRFLAIEPSGARAKQSAQRAVALMNLGVERKGHKEVTITVDVHSRKEEGDFGAVEIFAAMVAATGGLPDDKKADPAARLSDQIGGMLGLITETATENRGQEYVWQNVVPFFDAMSKRELVTPFAYVAFSTLELPGAKKWMEANRDAIDRYNDWRSHGGRVDAIPVPPKP